MPREIKTVTLSTGREIELQKMGPTAFRRVYRGEDIDITMAIVEASCIRPKFNVEDPAPEELPEGTLHVDDMSLNEFLELIVEINDFLGLEAMKEKVAPLLTTASLQ